MEDINQHVLFLKLKHLTYLLRSVTHYKRFDLIRPLKKSYYANKNRILIGDAKCKGVAKGVSRIFVEVQIKSRNLKLRLKN